MAAMLNNTILFLWDKMFILMQNIFIVPSMQHGRHAKSLYRSYALKKSAWEREAKKMEKKGNAKEF